MEADPTIDVLYPNAYLFGDPRTEGLTFMDLHPSKGEVTFRSSCYSAVQRIHFGNCQA